MKLSVHEISNRGLKDLSSLSPLEKDVFVINGLDLYFEMEGGLEDFILGEHQQELTWLRGTLQRIGDKDSEKIITSLCSMPEEQREHMQPLCAQFYDLRERRWQLVAAYLQSLGAELND